MNRPEKIHNVSMSQLSIARYYGGIMFNGAYYHCDATEDTLTRGDIWKASLAKTPKAAEKAAEAERKKWTDVQKSFAEFGI